MSDKKISQLTALPSAEVASDDLLVIVDSSAGANGTKKILVSDMATAFNNLQIGSFTWDSATSTPNSVNGLSQVVTSIHDMMRGCVLLDNGAVNYYLNPLNWAEKVDGTASDLTGADGQVMVEIPKFYYRTIRVGTITTWSISAFNQSGYVLHPAFIKDGVEVNFRYYGAYDACVYDVSGATYISGTNLDDNSANVDTTATTGDKLASVKSIYPMVGLTRAQFRTIGFNRGAGWRQLDFTLWSAVQMLYLIEYQSFYSQNILGAGNTNGGYGAASAVQADSPHTIAGAGDSISDGSTNITSGAGVNAKPGTSFMKYRGIENLYGNSAYFADGINVNVSSAGNVYVTNNATNWADDTATNYTLITSGLSTVAGFIKDLLPTDGYFLSSTNVGGSSSTYITDYHVGSAASNLVVFVGGSANYIGEAGAFCLSSYVGASTAFRSIGGRLAF